MRARSLGGSGGQAAERGRKYGQSMSSGPTGGGQELRGWQGLTAEGVSRAGVDPSVGTAGLRRAEEPRGTADRAEDSPWCGDLGGGPPGRVTSEGRNTPSSPQPALHLPAP